MTHEMEQRIISAISSLHAQLDALEALVNEHDATIEQLRYEGPTRSDVGHDDYDYYLEGEWDAL